MLSNILLTITISVMEKMLDLVRDVILLLVLLILITHLGIAEIWLK